jgi:hypothetical protein
MVAGTQCQFDELARALSADADLMRRTRRVVRRAKMRRVLDPLFEGLAGLALLWV